jgi:flagellar biosynthesis chaperone FliJ
MKNKKTVTKHDLRRAVINNVSGINYTMERLKNLENVLNYYIEMKRDEKKFNKFLDKKVKEFEKENEHKQSEIV